MNMEVFSKRFRSTAKPFLTRALRAGVLFVVLPLILSILRAVSWASVRLVSMIETMDYPFDSVNSLIEQLVGSTILVVVYHA